MKRVFRTLCLIAMVALVTTSCKKKEEGAEFNVTFGETYGFEVGPSLNGAKAYLDPWDGYKFKWNDGDQVMVYNVSATLGNSVAEVFTADPGSEGKQTARFTGTAVGPKKEHGYFVFYNANKAYGLPDDGVMETFRVPAVQNYNPTHLIDPTSLMLANTIGAAGESHINSFTLQHVFGYLNVAVGNLEETNARHVKSITVTDAKWHLSGELDVKLPEVSAQRFTELLEDLEDDDVTEAEYLAELHSYLTTLGYHAHGDNIPLDKSITLNCVNTDYPQGLGWNQYAWQYFFITLRPGALYKGFTIGIEFDENTNTEGYDITVTIPENQAMKYLIKPGWFRNIFVDTDGNVYDVD